MARSTSGLSVETSESTRMIAILWNELAQCNAEKIPKKEKVKKLALIRGIDADLDAEDQAVLKCLGGRHS